MTRDTDRQIDEELPELDDPESCPPGLAGLIFRLRSSLVTFVAAWWFSRSWKALLASLPGLVLGGIPLFLLAMGRHTPEEQRWEQYQAAAEAALTRGDGIAAEVYFRRLARLDAGSPAPRYGRGLAAALQGEQARARSLMQSLAPDNAAGFPDAHRWMATDILSRHSPLTPRAARVAEHHLRRVLAHDPTDEQAVSLLGVVLWSRGDVEGALPYLEQTAGQSPEWQLPLAALYEMRRDTPSARKAGERAAKYFSRLVDSNPTVWKYRLRWAQCEAFLKNYPQAVQILQVGLTADVPQPFEEALVDVYLAWYAATPKQTPDGLAKRLELLERALEHGPNDPRVLTQIAELSIRDGADSDATREALHQALANGTAPATVQLILGSQAVFQGDLARSQTHLELACRRAPNMPIVLNNLAWVLAQREPPELERALELASAAKRLSDHPEISDTLGMILARQGKNQEAITEFETALRALPDRPSIHWQLAELYEKLRNPELAEIHRRRAKSLEVDHEVE